MKLYEMMDELDKELPDNEVRFLDEKGVEYRPTLVEDEDRITYIKMEEIDVSEL